DHLRERDVVLGRMGLAEPLERAVQVAKFVGRKLPIPVLRGLPKPAMARLNRCDHEVADAGRIVGDVGVASGHAAAGCRVAKAIPTITAAGMASSATKTTRRLAGGIPAPIMPA